MSTIANPCPVMINCTAMVLSECRSEKFILTLSAHALDYAQI